MESGGCDIVYGLRAKRAESWLARATSVLFIQFLGLLTGYRVPINVATLRVMNRRFVDAYLSFQEKSRFLPGLENWLGFTSRYVPIKHQPGSRESLRTTFASGRSWPWKPWSAFPTCP